MTKNVPFDHPDFGKAFPCPVCTTGASAVQLRLDNLFRAAQFRTAYQRFTLADFEALPALSRWGKETAIAAAKSWADGATIAYADFDLADPGGWHTHARYSLVLCGPPGGGKTTLAAAAFRARLEREGAGLLIEFYDLINTIQAAYGSDDAGKSTRLLEAAQESPVLMIDDLGDPDRGSGGHSFAETDDRRQKLYSIINHRCASDLPTIITTNLTPDDVRDQFGTSGRIRDRLEEMAVWIEMSGVPLRPGVTADR